MSVVSKATYESLSTTIGDAFGAQKGAIPFISSGLTEVVELDDADQEFDLLFSFYTLDRDSDRIWAEPAIILA
jgi:hypothetical protein